MSICTFITEYDTNVTTFLFKVKERLKDNNFFKNPFTGKVITLTLESNHELNQMNIITLSPLWLDVTPFGWIIALGTYVIWGWSAWVIPGIVIGCLGIFWSKYFYTLMIYIGLRKEGYKGKFKLITNNTALAEIIKVT